MILENIGVFVLSRPLKKLFREMMDGGSEI